MGRSLVLGVDIGSANVVAALAEVVEGEPRVIGLGVAPCSGVRRGMVTDLNATAQAVTQAVMVAERAGRNGGGARAFLSIAGPHVLSVVSRAEVPVADPATGVSPDDVKAALNAAGGMNLPEGRQVIHVLPRTYELDGAEGIVDPVGLAGRTLASLAHLVTVDGLPVQNYLRSVIKAGVQVADYQLGLYAAAEAVLTQEERQTGAIMLQLGAGMTGVAVYAYGNLWHTALIPVGSEHITRDLATVLRLPLEAAERLKVERGWAAVALCPDTSLEEMASPGLKSREMQDKRLAQVIEPRVQEILQLAAAEVKRSGYDGLFSGGLILTGGGARLKGLVEAAENHFGLPARIGVPSGAMLAGPEFATVAGLLQAGARTVQPETVDIGDVMKDDQDKRGNTRNWLGGLFS